MISLLKSASNLELLDIRCCKKVTNTLVNAVVDNIVLKMIVKSEVHIDIDKISEISPLLHINCIEKYKRSIRCGGIEFNKRLYLQHL